jgi:formylglycine-generating enzyme required for sulfatase activity
MNVKVPAVLLVSLGLAFWYVYAAIPHKVLEPAGEFTMVLVPAGEFQMGSTPEEVTRLVEECAKDPAKDGTKKDKCKSYFMGETPRHPVALDAFYLDRYEVTNQLFGQFVRATGYQTTAERKGNAWAYMGGNDWQEVSGANWRQPEAGASVFDSNRATHPVVSVSWQDANTFCRSYGKRLPTEAEFEYANRAGTQTRYWWGDGSPGLRLVANIADVTNKKEFPGRPWPIMEGYTDGYARTAPVGSFEANAFGLYDMTGNAVEWTADWYGEKYYEVSPVRNPKGPSSGQYRVLRGGSWNTVPHNVRSALRDWDTPTDRHAVIGFRCAQEVPQ